MGLVLKKFIRKRHLKINFAKGHTEKNQSELQVQFDQLKAKLDKAGEDELKRKATFRLYWIIKKRNHKQKKSIRRNFSIQNKV